MEQVDELEDRVNREPEVNFTDEDCPLQSILNGLRSCVDSRSLSSAIQRAQAELLVEHICIVVKR